MDGGERTPDCFRCRSFYVTHDAGRPNGCRFFGFRSQRLPAHEVRVTTGRECQAFEPRTPDARTGSRPERAR